MAFSIDEIVGARLIANALGMACIVERTSDLFLILNGWSDGGNDACFGISSKRVFEDTSELAFSVRNVGCFIDQRIDDSAQCQ